MSKKKTKAEADPAADAPQAASATEAQDPAEVSRKIDEALASQPLREFTPDPEAVRQLALLEQRQQIVRALYREAETGRAGLGDSAMLRQVAAWVERGCR